MKKILFNILLAVMPSITAFADTDISVYDNVIYGKSATIDLRHSKSINISFCMKNKVDDIASYQFDIVTPEEISVAVDPVEPDFFLAKLSEERTSSLKHNTFSLEKQTNGDVRVICSSTRNYPFSGNDGEVCVVTFNVAPNTPNGNYTITLNNIVMADTQATAQTYKAENIEFTITVTTGTDIFELDAKYGKTNLFNLAGQRVDDSAKGIIINNGKKTLK